MSGRSKASAAGTRTRGAARASRDAHDAPSAKARPSRSAHALLSLATLATFARAVPYPLHVNWDDGRFIVDNPDVHEVSWRALTSIFGAAHFQAYHPLHLLSYWLDVPWLGASGPALHAVNLALWIVAVNLLLLVFVRLGLSNTASTMAALAFALHPLQVEVVAWATARKDVLALLFTCVCVLAHLRSQRGLDRYAWLARLAFVLAALSKTSALPLPAVLIACDVWLRGRSFRSALAVHLPSLLLAIGLGASVARIWSDQQMLRPASEAGPLIARVTASYTHALGSALWPSSVSPLYAVPSASYSTLLPWIVCAALLGAAGLAYARGAYRALFALVAFGLWMLPVSNALPMYFAYQDRYLSLPLFGLCFGLGAALDASRARSHAGGRVLGMLVALAVIALGLRAVQYAGVWSSEERLWGHAVRTQPDAYFAWMKLGEVRRKDGQLYGSIRAYQQLVRLDPRRKLGYAALLEAVALRDEALRSLTPSRAHALAQTFHASLEDGEGLRTFAGRMLRAGYVRSCEVALARSLAVSPLPDDALEYAAAAQFNLGHPLLALFYLDRMEKPTQREELIERAQFARRVRGDAPVL